MERIGGHVQMVLRCVFFLGVAEAGGRAAEDHHGRDFAGHLTGVVQRATRQLHVVALHRLHCARAPAVVTVPEQATLRKVDLALELQVLSFYGQRDSIGSSLRDELGVSVPAKNLGA